MDNVVIKHFFKNLMRKANWENPLLKVGKNRYMRYFLKDGNVVVMKRERLAKNFFWKYSVPLKYYFKKFFVYASRIKEMEYESISRKWQIEERFTEETSRFDGYDDANKTRKGGSK
jgi:hypothetical protein